MSCEGGDHDPTRAVGEIVDTFAHDFAAEAVDGDVDRVTVFKFFFQDERDVFFRRDDDSVGVEVGDAFFDLDFLSPDSGGEILLP